jgi:hypothetical protein
VIHRGVDQVDRPNHVVVVIEPLDEVAQSFRRIRGEVIHVVELVAREQLIDQRVVKNRPLRKDRALRDVLDEPAAEIVKDDDAVALAQQVLGNV